MRKSPTQQQQRQQVLSRGGASSPLSIWYNFEVDTSAGRPGRAAGDIMSPGSPSAAAATAPSATASSSTAPSGQYPSGEHPSGHGHQHHHHHHHHHFPKVESGLEQEFTRILGGGGGGGQQLFAGHAGHSSGEMAISYTDREGARFVNKAKMDDWRDWREKLQYFVTEMKKDELKFNHRAELSGEFTVSLKITNKFSNEIWRRFSEHLLLPTTALVVPSTIPWEERSIIIAKLNPTTSTTTSSTFKFN